MITRQTARWLLLWGLCLIEPCQGAAIITDPCEGLWWREVHPPNSPGTYVHQAAAYDSRRAVAVLFGGGNHLPGGGVVPYSDQTWEWNGQQWTKRSPLVQPHARDEAAMAYDSERGVCVLFGGGTNSLPSELPFNDTWEWDGAVWTMRRPNDPSAGNSPPPLDYPQMTYDSLRKRTVLIGGWERVAGELIPARRTWEWDGTVWTVHDRSTTPSPAPPPLLGSAIAFDAVRRVTVLFGGFPAEGGDYQNETWTWDGKEWRLAASGGTPPRWRHGMAFDARRKVMVLFGGEDHIGTILDTSEWDGISWKRLPVAVSLTIPGIEARRSCKMWYDSAEQRAMVFGGDASGGPADSRVHTIYTDLWEARPPGRWVDFNYPGMPAVPETGEFYQPFNSLSEAVDSATPGCTLILKPGSTAENLKITKRTFLEAYSGKVVIGRTDSLP